MAGKLILVLGASPCGPPEAAWASLQHGGWVPRMSISRDRTWKLLVLEMNSVNLPHSVVQPVTESGSQGRDMDLTSWWGKHQRIWGLYLRNAMVDNY